MIRAAALALASLLVSGLVSGLAAGCTSATDPPDLSGSRAVAFTVPDPSAAGRGIRLEGRLFEPTGDARVPGVVLAHMLPADQRSWFDIAATLADEGYLALTFDFRGYCPEGIGSEGTGGCSEGEKEPAGAPADLVAAIAFLRTQGASSVSVIGASMGGTAGLVAAASLEGSDPVPAVVTLSAPVRVEDLAVDTPMLQTQTAKLFIAGTGDAVAADAAQELYSVATAPKRVEIFPSDEHGSDLLTGARGGEIERLILLWLDQHA